MTEQLPFFKQVAQDLIRLPGRPKVFLSDKGLIEKCLLVRCHSKHRQRVWRYFQRYSDKLKVTLMSGSHECMRSICAIETMGGAIQTYTIFYEHDYPERNQHES